MGHQYIQKIITDLPTIVTRYGCSVLGTFVPKDKALKFLALTDYLAVTGPFVICTKRLVQPTEAWSRGPYAD